MAIFLVSGKIAEEYLYCKMNGIKPDLAINQVTSYKAVFIHKSKFKIM